MMWENNGVPEWARVEHMEKNYPLTVLWGFTEANSQEEPNKWWRKRIWTKTIKIISTLFLFHPFYR